jgi:hypothetical protein
MFYLQPFLLWVLNDVDAYKPVAGEVYPVKAIR